MNLALKAGLPEATRSTGAETWQPTRYLHAVLERSTVGVALLDEEARVVVVNPALAAILEQADRLVIRAGRVSSTIPSENYRLQAAIAACRSVTGDPSVSLDVPVWGTAGDHALIVTVCAVEVDATTERSPRPVLLYAVDTAPSIALDSRFLRSAFQLSEAEAVLARLLLEGATLADAAAVRGISLHTARSQLKSIMLKTGVNRQADLVNLLSRCNAVLRDAPRSSDRPS